MSALNMPAAVRPRSVQIKMIYLLTGDGAGKTTAALGMVLRALGHNLKAVVIQFLKGRKDGGEYKVKTKLGSGYSLYQFGRRQFVDLKKPRIKDKKLAANGLNFARQILKAQPPDLLVLDEINLAVATKVLDLNDVLKFLKQIPRSVNVILTGRNAPKELIKLADRVSYIKDLKHPLKKGARARKGIEY